MHTPTDLIETYLTGVTSNLGYPVGMGMPVNPDTVRKWAVDVTKLTGTDELVAALETLLEAVRGRHVTVGDCNQARAALAKVRP